MWYDNLYEEVVEVIRSADKKLSRKEYMKIAKEKNLPNLDTLRYITNLQFEEFVINIRKDKEI